MKMNFQNHLFIASPSMEDDLFAGSVLLICEHNEKGALGVIINRPTNILMGDIYQQLALIEPQENIAHRIDDQHHQFAHFGGPVNSERGLVLHERDGQWQYSIDVNNYINLTTSQDIMKAIAHGNGPKRNVFILGYASWEPEQIEAEILNNSWLTIPLDNTNDSTSFQRHNQFQIDVSMIFNLLFNTPADKQWSKSIELLGIDSSKLSNEVGHA